MSKRQSFYSYRPAICREIGRFARKSNDKADGAGEKNHDGQSRDEKRINLDLANVGADGVHATVRSCECELRWKQKFESIVKCSDQRTDLTAYFVNNFIQNEKWEHYDEELKETAWNAGWNGAKMMTPRNSATD